jgi:hypothetical protein
MADPRAAPARVVIVDDRVGSIRVIVYDGSGGCVTIPVSAHRALDLAEQLIAAARARLGA